mmetsp:Transcript_31905/g.74923  ORF Transcript_31905/g.74923 Transcript_31905/m.74923 type:complete len:206 (+) Transcript_31905:2016-2633(+)
MAALLHRRQAEQPRRGHRLQPRGLRRPRQQRPGRQVHQHRLARRRLPGQALRRPPERRPRRGRPHAAGCTARAEQHHRRALRNPRVRQGPARDHGAGRQGQRVRRPAQALGTGQAGRHGRGPARCLQRLHRGLPAADDLLEAGAAGAGPAGRSLPEGRAAAVERQRPRARRPPDRRLPAPDAARGPGQGRGAVRGAAGAEGHPRR